MRLIAASLILPVILLTGCATKSQNEICYDASTFTIDKDEYAKPIDFDKIMSNAVKATAIKANLPAGQKIIVTDFVEVGTLKNDTKLGFILSNKLKNALVQTEKFKVEEVEVSKFFRIGKHGLKLLSRNEDNLLNHKLKLRYALVGTYTVTPKRLIIFVKLINITNGLITESYSKDVPATSEIIGLASGNSN